MHQVLAPKEKLLNSNSKINVSPPRSKQGNSLYIPGGWTVIVYFMPKPLVFSFFKITFPLNASSTSSQRKIIKF